MRSLAGLVLAVACCLSLLSPAAVVVVAGARSGRIEHAQLKAAEGACVSHERLMRDALASLHYRLFDSAGYEEDEYRAELDRLVFEHSEAHQVWRDACGAVSATTKQAQETPHSRSVIAHRVFCRFSSAAGRRRRWRWR
jgi:hypothetical protein